MIQVFSICSVLTLLILQSCNATPFFGNNIAPPTNSLNIANAANTIISSIGLYANDVAALKSKVPAGSPSVTTAAIAVLEIANKLPQLFLPFFTILSKTPTNKTTEPTCIFADLNRTIDSALDFTLNLTSTIDSFHVPMADYLANTMQAALSCLYQQTIVVQDHLDSLGSTIMSLRLAGTTVTTANVLTGLPATFITTFTTALTKLNTCLQDLEKSVRLSVSLIQSANNILLNFNTTVVNAKRTIATFTTTYNNSLFLTTTNFQRSVQTMRTNIKNTYTQVVARLITFKTLIVGPIVSSANQFAVDTYNSLESLYAADYMAVSPQILQDLNTNPDGINYIISLANDLTNEIANAMMKDARGKAVSCGNPATSAINSALSDIIYLIETNCGIAAVSQVQTLLGASYNALLNDLQTKAVDYAKYLNACLNSNSQVCLDKEKDGSNSLLSNVQTAGSLVKTFYDNGLLYITDRIGTCVTVQSAMAEARFNVIRNNYLSCFGVPIVNGDVDVDADGNIFTTV